MGPISPARWQFWQRRWRIGATSLLNVTAADTAAQAAPKRMVRSTGMDRSTWIGILDERQAKPPPSKVLQSIISFARRDDFIGRIPNNPERQRGDGVQAKPSPR